MSRGTGQTTRLGAIGLYCGAVLLFSVLDASAKFLATVKALPVMEIVWLRFFGQFVYSSIILGPRNLQSLAISARPALQWLRSLFMLGATFFNFLAIKYLQLDQTVTIFFLAPFLVAALAGPLLGEWIGWRRLTAISVGFFGVVLVMRPGAGGIHWAIVYSFGATISYAFYNIATRYLAAHDSNRTTLFYTPLAGLVLTLPLALLSWRQPLDLESWALLLSLGVTGGIGHWLLILAHRAAPAPILSPFVYTGLLWMVTLGYFVFGDLPSLWTLAGGGVIILSGLYLLSREQHR